MRKAVKEQNGASVTLFLPGTAGKDKNGCFPAWDLLTASKLFSFYIGTQTSHQELVVGLDEQQWRCLFSGWLEQLHGQIRSQSAPPVLSSCINHTNWIIKEGIASAGAESPPRLLNLESREADWKFLIVGNYHTIWVIWPWFEIQKIILINTNSSFSQAPALKNSIKIHNAEFTVVDPQVYSTRLVYWIQAHLTIDQVELWVESFYPVLPV